MYKDEFKKETEMACFLISLLVRAADDFSDRFDCESIVIEKALEAAFVTEGKRIEECISQ